MAGPNGSYPSRVNLPVDLETVRNILRHHGVSFALVFGSHATGTTHERSDVDLAVWSTRPIDIWLLDGELPDGIDLLDLSTAPEGLAGRVALEGVVVLDDDPPRRIRWQADTRKRHLDEAFRRRRFQEDFRRAHG